MVGGLDHICVLERWLWLWELDGHGGEPGGQGTSGEATAAVLVRNTAVNLRGVGLGDRKKKT